jgi:hypothetical protein
MSWNRLNYLIIIDLKKGNSHSNRKLFFFILFKIVMTISDDPVALENLKF